MRIITYRLDKVLIKHNILEGSNFVSLSKNSIANLIYLLNNIFKDLKQKNKELQVLFQDMCKAFNSVSLEIVKRALIRIKLLEVTTNFILSLYEKRKIKVVTSFSLTSEFEAEDGIDQEEVIFLQSGISFIILYYVQFKKQKIQIIK